MRSILASLALALLLAAAPAAGASSITYIKDGDVWLSSPDGAKQYRVTYDGGWKSPSQADDGTLLAQKGVHFVRMDRSGHVLSTSEGLGGDTPLPAAWTDGYDRVYGPYDPKISPDGRQVAYWFRTETTTSAPGSPGGFGAIDDWTTAQPVDASFSTPERSVKGDNNPSWIDGHRTLVTATWATGGLTASTWVVGGGSLNEQWWFTDPNAILQDGELSPDGTIAVFVAATHGASSPFDGVRFYVTNGPAWTHDPPYENAFGSDDFPQPASPVCQDTRDSEAHQPTWAPDSSAIAYDDQDGVWIEPVPADVDAGCESMSSTLLIPGGREPDWGPADVDLAQAPAPPGAGGTAAGGTTGGTAGTPTGGKTTTPPPAGAMSGTTTPSAGAASSPVAAIAGLRVPRSVAQGRGIRVTFTLASAGSVRVALRRRGATRRLTLRGRAGANAAVLRPGRLSRGRWTLAVTAGGTTLHATFRVR